MNLPSSLSSSSDFDWWLNSINSSVSKIKGDKYSLEIFTDASTTGWGAACRDDSTMGPWSEQERLLHINYLEILAAFLGLKAYAKDVFNCQILLRVDNTTAISYINRMGGVQFPHMTDITKKLWQWCEAKNIFIYADYIRSCDNTVADAESRKTHPDIE